MAGTLYLIPTPIGNLGDITQRAIETLKRVKKIACEDTRTSAVLLQHCGIEVPTVSYHKFNERSRIRELLNDLRRGDDIALISDAGTPGISDPAYLLVSAAVEAGIVVCPLPGPTAFVPALTASGLPSQPFLFLGFPPEKPGELKRLLDSVRELPATLVFYESPHRFRTTLARILEALGNRRAAVARELTKLYESFYRGTLEALLTADIPEKGEFVLLVEGASRTIPTDEELRDMLSTAQADGLSLREAATRVAEATGARPNHVYRLGLGKKLAMPHTSS